MPDMELQERDADGFPVLVPAGDLEARSVADLRSMLRKWQGAERPCVMIDMSDVRFLDTSGLAHLIETHLRFDKQGGKLVLFGLRPMIADVFEVTRVDSFFHIVETREEAVAALREHGAR